MVSVIARRRRVGQGGKPTFVYLLLAARLVEFSNPDVDWTVEVGDGWIVEGEMSVFANAAETQQWIEFAPQPGVLQREVYGVPPRRLRFRGTRA